MKVREATITKNIVKALAARGAWVFKVQGGALQKMGLPDLVGHINGAFFAIEVKVPGEDPPKLQQHRIAGICAAGGVAGVATSVDEALAIVDRADASSQPNRKGDLPCK